MMKNWKKSSETNSKGPLEPKAHVTLLLDPKLILEYIDIWHKDPNTPMLDFKLTPGEFHMLTAFVGKEKWKFEKAK